MTAATVIPFRFESHEVRTLTINGEPWFVAKDVCDILGYLNSRKAISDHLDEDEKGVTDCYTLGGVQEMTVISESGLLYTLIVRSNKPQAKAFRKWVTAEVLPAIRKTGFYRQAGAAQCQNTPESFILIAREFRATLRLARAMGLKGTAAIQEASRLTGELTGFEPLNFFDAADLFAQQDSESAAGSGKTPGRKRAKMRRAGRCEE